METADGNGRPARTSSRSGFSLIEIVIVMAVTVIMVVLAGPPIVSLLNSTGLSSASRDVSNHLVKARSEAIAKHSLTRFMVAKTWPEKEEGYSRYSIWRWNAENSEFVQSSEWASLPKGIVFEPRLPSYISKSSYAANDATITLGEFAMSLKEASGEVVSSGDKPVETQFVEFLPNGSARIEGGILNKVIFVLVEGDIEEVDGTATTKYRGEKGKSPENWAQINLETLTGRVRIYRP